MGRSVLGLWLSRWSAARIIVIAAATVGLLVIVIAGAFARDWRALAIGFALADLVLLAPFVCKHTVRAAPALGRLLGVGGVVVLVSAWFGFGGGAVAGVVFTTVLTLAFLAFAGSASTMMKGGPTCL